MAGDSKPSFAPLQISDSEGWGPSKTPSQFEGLPYLPFGKADKLGKIADWTSTGNQFPSRFPSRHHGGPDVQSVFSFSSADEGTFTLVDNQKQLSKMHRPRKPQFTQRIIRTPQNQPTTTARRGRQNLPKSGKKWRQNMHRYAGYRQNFEKRSLEPSIQVKEDWNLVQEVDINTLSKLTGTVEESEIIAEVGNVYYVNPSYFNISARNEKNLQSNEAAFFDKTTSDDLVIRSLVGQGNVFATDSVLSLLMASPRSIIPWDIIIQRVGKKVFLDKREGSKIDLLSVGETSVEPPTDDKDSFNSATALSKEATLIDQYFARQILDESKEPIKLNSGNIPDEVDLKNKHRGYRYRKIIVSDTVTLVTRCDVDGVKAAKSGAKYFSIYALNEYDPKVSGIEWRKKIDQQPGAVFATELKNNSFKLARWGARALLAGSDSILLGYVSRLNPKDPNTHAILKVQAYQPSEFIQNINVSQENMWGILKALLQLFLGLKDGKYVLMKDPSEPKLSLYQVPDNFDE